MITLGVITYIVISLLLSWNYTRTTYSLADGHREGMETKRAFKYGFLTIPVMILFVGVFLGAFLLFAYTIVGIMVLCGWIITNMP